MGAIPLPAVPPPAIPLPKSCGLYLPGHEVHWIQGIHSSDPGERPPVPGRILEIRDEGTVIVQLQDRALELWNHDPARLTAVVAQHGYETLYQEGWHLLRVPPELTAYCFCTALAGDPRRTCPTTPARYATAAEQLFETGGFTIRAADVLASLESRTEHPKS